jgi:DNA-binding response OmpR family regulator
MEAKKGPKKILIIDDDKTIQAALKAVLSSSSYLVESALDAMQGTILIRKMQPDLVILDINMPAGGGFSVYERLKTSPGAKASVLVYSIVERDKIKAQFPELPDSSILSKPSPPAEVLASVQKLLA